MIPRLHEISNTQKLYLNFLRRLEKDGFKGDISPEYAERVVSATDNSIYQVLPQGIVYPKNIDDLVLLARVSHEEPFQQIVLSARGGGTGTNGQSLTDGLVVDISKHMNAILEINAEERWVRVQAGVVKDQLNAALKPYGLFFAPELSTSNRATIGGMINTDASGQGSVMYGKTRDHVLALKTVLLDGTVINTAPVEPDKLSQLTSGEDRIASIYQTVADIYDQHQADIKALFPPLNRCLTGYDLAHIRDEQQRINLNNILCGSEGTLGFITEATLNVLQIPKTSALVCVQYGDFETSLRDAQALMACHPTSIETVDSKVLGLAKDDLIWNSVAQFFPEPTGQTVAGINLVEYTADTDEELKQKVAVIQAELDAVCGKAGKAIQYAIAWGHEQVNQVWNMRKKSVGFLGNAQGEARPIPFVEDTAVPPENLADYIMEFRAILDEYNLQYGMFGHVDAGVLHVRPALDMKDPEQEKMVRVITDRLVSLIRKYNGLLWGEHGKGVRSEYAPDFFGNLYPQLQKIKQAFDPHNQLNPGKIATPLESPVQLLKIDKVTTRGQLDRTIEQDSWQQYSESMYCNGNGACFNYDAADAMCPSWKATRIRKYSPKGRSSLIREWLRLLSDKQVDTVQESGIANYISWPVSIIPRLFNTLKKRNGEYDFNHEVYDAMSTCLACKSCTGSCPIKVDIPESRAKFLHLYHARYLRPLKDYLIGSLEFLMPTLALWKDLYNKPIRWKPVNWFLRNIAGMVDSPLISDISLKQEMKKHQLPWATALNISRLSKEQKNKAVIYVQDAFTSYFDTQVVVDTLLALRALGFHPMVMPYMANGKPLHVHGFLSRFQKTAFRTANKLKKMQNTGIPLIGLDPSTTLTYRAEYKKYLEGNPVNVMLIQEFLSERQDVFADKTLHSDDAFHILGHCTEKTNAASSIQQWQQVFKVIGLTLNEIKVGCCGMAGTFGHETRNQDISRKIYELSWQGPVKNPKNQGKLLTTGYSCRSQVKRYEHQTLLHPMQQILKSLSEKND
ncbi:D-2-hydroxyglutarate dehydrogenase YdiJ [Gynuella sunshinyii]|uniref:D-2-hydroxyglutarate dehydrogenase n=1 Tax=Gynuella sunshinyii YC6258 TaxID=1445510 RepID=A0A0C5VNS4_9GAMM|nr:FAD-binding and (Fe-S)-binding domain-containing protein [Gynuella sunshinyii]AJQ95961.1 FAD/FMN-containing dehydrogenase [Gynuella sunshinyii YC6258]